MATCCCSGLMFEAAAIQDRRAAAEGLALPSRATHVRYIWPHVWLICFIMVLRQPSAVFHPQFWAEDGMIFYHDAYTNGLPSLWHSLGGYLNTLSRLVAMLSTLFPLAWAPAIFAAFGVFFQILPVVILLSDRLVSAIPNARARLALAYFYAVIPNSYELNFNLVNAQWHLAMAAFLILVSRPPQRWFGRVLDGALLLLSCLSGPFGIFLLPIAWFEHYQKRARLTNSIIVLAATVIQLGYIFGTHATVSRLLTPLGATPLRFFQIVTNQIVLGGLIGSNFMQDCLSLEICKSAAFFIAVGCLGGGMFAVASVHGPVIYRKAAIFAGGLFVASLITPVASALGPQWEQMTDVPIGMRYFAIPVLVWFSTGMVLLSLNQRGVKAVGGMIVMLGFFCAGGNFRYPKFPQTHFAARAAMFASTSRGSAEQFPENPDGWLMTLTKR